MRYLQIIFITVSILVILSTSCNKNDKNGSGNNISDTLTLMCKPPPTILFNFTVNGQAVQSSDIRAHYLYYLKDGSKIFINDFGRVNFSHPFYLDAYGSREMTSRSYFNQINTFYIDYWDNNDIDTISLVTTGIKTDYDCIFSNVVKFNGKTVRTESTSLGPLYPLILLDK